MSNQDVGYWTGGFSYMPSWAPSPITVNIGQMDANGVDWLWMSIVGWDSPTTVGQVVQRASDHGGWATEQYFTARAMTLTVHASAPTQALRDAARAALQMAIPVNDLCTLTYNEPIQKQMQVRRSGQILETYPSLTDVEFQCVLIAPDPRKYNVTLKTFTTTLAPNTNIGFTPPFTMPITPPAQTPGGSVNVSNIGSFETRPVITIHGPMIGPSIIYDNGKFISYSQLTLHTGDTLVIDTDAKTGLFNGSYRNADINSWWWVLQPGTHVIQLGGTYTSAGSNMSVSYRDAWV